MLKRKREEPSTQSESRHFHTSRPYISTGEAAQIMGISRWTVLRRLESWKFSSIRHCMLEGRWAFDTEDVIRFSYPSASDAEVTMMMKEYRQKFADARRRKPSEDHYASDFFSKLKMVLEAGGGNVVIYRKTNTQENPSPVAEITLAQALAGRIRLEGSLLDQLEDGVYAVNIRGKDKEVLGEYEFSVDTSPETHTGKMDDVSKDPRQADLDSRRELVKLMAQYYMDNEYDEDDDDDDESVYDAEYDE